MDRKTGVTKLCQVFFVRSIASFWAAAASLARAGRVGAEDRSIEARKGPLGSLGVLTGKDGGLWVGLRATNLPL